MIWFTVTALAYVLPLVFIRPAPESLRDARPSLLVSARQISASLLVGLLLIAVFAFTTRGTFWEVSTARYALLALNNDLQAVHLWPIQLFTHLLVHASPLHLLANLSMLALASLYERRVGHGRFLRVLLVASLCSVPSAWLYTQGYTVCGLSGGIFGLGAAYVCDHPNLSLKDWLVAIALFAFVATLLSVANAYKVPDQPGMQTDHIGHALGAIGAIVYCMRRPQRTHLAAVAD